MDNNIALFKMNQKSKDDKENLILALKEANLDFNKLEVINIVGTNGKGTTSNLLAQQLQLNYKKVGLFTSPSFLEHNERIKINNKSISDKKLKELISKYEILMNKYNLIFFSKWVFLSIAYFLENEINILVCEAGIGGELDSTSIYQNQKAVLITSISEDHKDILGCNIKSIINNKINITKKNTPVFIADSNKKYFEIFVNYNFKLVWAKKHITYINNINKTDNYGLVQSFMLYYDLEFQNSIYNNFSLLGRWTKIQEEPYEIILDGAHNMGGIKNLINTIENTKMKKPILLLAFSKNKDYENIIKYLELKNIQFYLTLFKSPFSWEALDEKYEKYLVSWKDFIKNNNKNLLISGSLYFITIVYKYLKGKNDNHFN